MTPEDYEFDSEYEIGDPKTGETWQDAAKLIGTAMLIVAAIAGFFILQDQGGSSESKRTSQKPAAAKAKAKPQPAKAKKAQVILNEDELKNGDLVGSWIDDNQWLGGSISIYRDGNGYKMYRKFKDGSNTTYPVKREGRTFRMLDSDDHYTIDKNNNLELRDSDGLIRVAKLE